MKSVGRYLTYLNVALSLVSLFISLYMHEPYIGWACSLMGWTVVALKER